MSESPLNNIYPLSPIDKTAALVSKQPVEVARYEDLRAEAKNLLSRINQLPKSSKERKALIRQKCNIDLEINKIRPTARKKARSFENILLDVVKEKVPDFKWKEWVRIASAREKKIKGGSEYAGSEA